MRIWAFTSLLVLFAITATSAAQERRIAARPQVPAPPPRGTLVALVDMVKVFKAHPAHQEAIGSIRQQIQEFDQTIKIERETIAKLAKEQKQHRLGSPRYKELDKQIVSGSADLQLRMQLKRKEILESEAKVFYKTYREVMQHLDRFCVRYNIQLVLRHDSQEVDPNDRKSVQDVVNRGVILQRNLDITDVLIQNLKK